MKIAVGSKNPLKLDAVKNVARRVFGPVQVEGVEVNSGVSHNPLSDSETIAGAVTRAKAAREKSGADLGVGIEGGITEVDGNFYTCVWCAVDTGGELLTGGGVHIPVPPKVLRMITRDQMEMGAAMDRLTSIEDTKRKMGFEGIITKGLISRQDSFETVVGYALAKLISPELYR
jgi:inosine/xanthosine triphosphatase